MKRALLILAVAVPFVIFFPSVTDGGTATTLNVIAVEVRNDGTFLIDISQPNTGGPACATVTNRLSANSNTAGGKALLQLAISVYLSGKPISLTGTGACNEVSNIESIALLNAH